MPRGRQAHGTHARSGWPLRDRHGPLAGFIAADEAATCSALAGLAHEVHAQAGKKIEPAVAAELLRAVDAIENALSCP
jgi:hypothetical protein